MQSYLNVILTGITGRKWDKAYATRDVLWYLTVKEYHEISRQNKPIFLCVYIHLAHIGALRLNQTYFSSIIIVSMFHS